LPFDSAGLLHGTAASRRRLLEQLAARPENATCADCGSGAPPAWVSVGLGAFLCELCAGEHDNLRASVVRELQPAPFDSPFEGEPPEAQGQRRARAALGWCTEERLGGIGAWGNERASREWEFHVPPARFYLRELHTCLGTKTSWSGRVKLTRQALRDLHWWRDVPQRWAARSMWRATDTAYLHCDASGTVGWGGVLNGLTPARGLWRPEQESNHITLKELKAVRFTVETFLLDLKGKKVLLWEDNQSVVGVLTNLSSRSPAMMAELRKLWWLMDTHDITLRARYIRSAANVWADALSRDRTGQGTWQLKRDVFTQLDGEWGPHTVDRFATANDKQLPRFNSRERGPGCEAVDAMAQPDAEWRRERNWCHPPWALLPALAAKLRVSGASATVVAPTWRSAPWYGELLALCSELRVEPARRDLFERAPAQGPTSWSVTVFKVPLRA
jgi:hypothetical protein